MSDTEFSLLFRLHSEIQEAMSAVTARAAPADWAGRRNDIIRAVLARHPGDEVIERIIAGAVDDAVGAAETLSEPAFVFPGQHAARVDHPN